MPEIKHTPGPWRAVNLDEEGFFPSVYMGENLTYSDNSGTGDHRLVINEGQPEGKYWGNQIEVCRANALLIAAAPDMLAALKAIQQVFFANGEGIFRGKLAHQVHAAINKAGGAA